MQTKIKPCTVHYWHNPPVHQSTTDIAGMSHDMNVVTLLEGY
jgi:hypothetical protein